MRLSNAARLVAGCLLVAALGFAVARGPRRPPVSPVSFAALPQSETVSAESVHPTTETEIAMVRAMSPGWSGPALTTLHVRWCRSQDACRPGS